MIRLLLFWLLITFSVSCIVKYNSKVAKKIFEENETYLLLVKLQASQIQQQSKHVDWCSLPLPVAFSQASSKLYSSLLSFIGYKDSNFFAIIDPSRKKKYLLPFHEKYSAQQVNHFVASFFESTLMPFYASQPLPVQILHENKVQHLVGMNYQSFLIRPQPIKIVFLHTTDSMCTFCSHFLRKLQQITQKQSDSGVIVFGAFDVMKNDTPFIVDEIFPYFLIYVGDNLEDPYGVDTEDFKQIEMYIKQLKKDYKRAIQKQTEKLSEIDQQNL